MRQTYVFHLAVFSTCSFGWGAELLAPKQENLVGSTRKNNSAHVRYFIEKYDRHLQLSRSFLEVIHCELWAPNVQLPVRKPIIITFERFWSSVIWRTQAFIKETYHERHILYGRNVVSHNCSINVMFSKEISYFKQPQIFATFPSLNGNKSHCVPNSCT